MSLAPDWAEIAARAFEPPQERARRWATPGDLARDLDPRTVQTPALDLIDAELVRVANTPDSRLIISMPPQEGKSTRAAGDFPAWLLTQDPDLRIVTASYGQSLANRNGRAIRRRITSHPDLGLRIAGDLITAETATYRALNPRGIHWAPVNLACDDHDTSDLGERIPCLGRMWAKVGTEVMPDLVCDHNPEHTVEPGTWERQGWRRRLRQPLHPSGMARLAQRLAR